MMSKPPLREALQAAREFASGWQYAGKQWDEARELVRLADEALAAADDAARGTMREEFEAWYAMLAEAWYPGLHNDIAWSAWQAASRAAATHSAEPLDDRLDAQADAIRFRWLAAHPDWHFIEFLCRQVVADSAAEFLSELRRVIDARRSMELSAFEQHAALSAPPRVKEEGND